MKSGIVLIPFVDSKSGDAYQINDKFTASKKRFEELLNAGLVSDGKEVEPEEPTDNVDEEQKDTEEVENQEPTDELNEDSEDAESENTEESTEEPTDNVDEENKTE